MLSTNAPAPRFFKTPFTPAYWKLSLKEFRSLRILAIASLLIALDVVVARFYIPVGVNLRIYFNYLITSLLSLICGPVVGVAAGFVRDTIGFSWTPPTATFSAIPSQPWPRDWSTACSSTAPGLSVARIALCKAVINVFVNILMGSLWSAMLFQKGYLYYLSKSVVKNLLLLPAEILLLVLLYQVLLPVLTRMKLIPAQPSRRIPIF